MLNHTWSSETNVNINKGVSSTLCMWLYMEAECQSPSLGFGCEASSVVPSVPGMVCCTRIKDKHCLLPLCPDRTSCVPSETHHVGMSAGNTGTSEPVSVGSLRVRRLSTSENGDLFIWVNLLWECVLSGIERMICATGACTFSIGRLVFSWRPADGWHVTIKTVEGMDRSVVCRAEQVWPCSVAHRVVLQHTRVGLTWTRRQITDDVFFGSKFSFEISDLSIQISIWTHQI